MKKVLALFVVCLLAFNLFGCVMGQETAQRAVENTLKALKKGDVKTLSKYLHDNEMLNSDLLSGDHEALLKMCVEHLSYKIINAEENDDSAVVSVEITNVDMAKVCLELSSRLLVSTFSGKERTNEETLAIFGELIEKFKDKTVTVQIDIHLSKEDGQWKIEAGETFQNAILGGLSSALLDLYNSFRGLAD